MFECFDLVDLLLEDDLFSGENILDMLEGDDFFDLDIQNEVEDFCRQCFVLLINCLMYCLCQVVFYIF